MIKLCETKIRLVCRAEDAHLIEEIIESTVAEFKDKMIAEVKSCEGKSASDIKCEVFVDKKHSLPSWDSEQKKGSLGGFVMYTRKNRIVCSQKIDDRMELVFQQAIPTIRRKLFPSMPQGKGMVEYKAHVPQHWDHRIYLKLTIIYLK